MTNRHSYGHTDEQTARKTIFYEKNVQEKSMEVP